MDYYGDQLPHNQLDDNKPKANNTKKIVLWSVGLVVVAAIGFGIALMQGENSPESNETPITTEAPVDNNLPEQTRSNDISATQNFVEYKADFPRIQFSYPKNWTVDADNQQEDIKITSPEFSYDTITGNTIDGHFRVYIRQGARQQDSKYIGRGIAALPSQTLVYNDPTSNQRPETNLSLFGLDDSKNFAYFLVAGNFRLEPGDSLGPEYGTEPETYIITGGYSSNELEEDMATNPVSLSYFETTNAYKQALKIIKSVKLF